MLYCFDYVGGLAVACVAEVDEGAAGSIGANEDLGVVGCCC